MKLDKYFTSTATYWGPGVPDGYGGTTWPDPVIISVRWEGRNELFVDSNGEEVRSQSIVYPNQNVELGGYLYHGESTASDPTTVDGALKIRAVRKIPNLRSTQSLTKVWL